jgi:hypothetical protein
VNLWTQLTGRPGPVDNHLLSPVAAHSATALRERKRGVFPVLHTLYDYDKGIS